MSTEDNSNVIPLHPEGVIQLTHANLNRQVSIVAAQVFGWYYSEEHKATLVMSVGSSVVPVKESATHVGMQVSKMCKRGN